jgi:DNA-binding LacI/PurR family transcriptional regulator
MKVTAKDVAIKCNTSTAAVSRAFRADSVIDFNLRTKILFVARELGYLPPAKRIKQIEGYRTISIVVGDILNPFYPNALEMFAKEMTMRGHHMLVHVVPSDEAVDSTISQVLKTGSDAAIIASANLSSDLAHGCKQRGMPVVLFNRIQTDGRINAVCTDNYNGGLLAAERLLARNCSSVGFIGGIRDTSTHLERRRGFIDGLNRQESRLTFEESGAYDYNESFAVISNLLEGPLRPDGLFCANDIMAFAAIDASKKIGMVVGEDIAILGFDDVPMAAWTAYDLTSFRQRIRQMVTNTVNLIEGMWQNPDVEGELIMVRSRFIERSSG